MSGQITTCYSFKGGSGRSMSLANLAWDLATRGLRVLVVDWDLEAPGVHRYFHPFLSDPSQEGSEGLIDALWAYVNAIPEGAVHHQPEWAVMQQYVQHLTLPLDGRGGIDLLGAGRQDEIYTTKVGNFDWNLFYSRLGGKSYIDEFGKWARNQYDHILIDSRTGVSDTAGICTMQLPDVLALFFVYNRQSIEGAAAAGRAVRRARRDDVRIVPCPSRVEDKRIAGPARQYAALCLESIIGEPTAKLARMLRVNEVMHFPWCSYEEKLAVFEDEPDEIGSLLQATQALSARVAGSFDGAIEVVERERLNSIWRRAAFRDTRLDELEVLRSVSPSQRANQIKAWLSSALREQAAPTTWEMALAAEAITLSASPQGMNAAEAEQMAEGGLCLLRRLLREKCADQAAAAEIMRTRLSSLIISSRHEEALALAGEAVALVRGDSRQSALTALAQLLETKAEVERLAGDHRSSLASLDELVSVVDRLPAQRDDAHRSIRTRAQRARADSLLEAGKFDEAMTASDQALRLSKASGAEGRREAALARLTTVRAALADGRPRSQEFAEELRRWVRRAKLPNELQREIDIRLALAQADSLRESGKLEEAQALLRNLGGNLPTWASAEAAKVSARIAVVGSMAVPPPEEGGSPDVGPPKSDRLLEVLQHALQHAADDATRRKLILDYLTLRSASSDGNPLPERDNSAAAARVITDGLLRQAEGESS